MVLGNGGLGSARRATGGIGSGGHLGRQRGCGGRWSSNDPRKLYILLFVSVSTLACDANKAAPVPSPPPSAIESRSAGPLMVGHVYVLSGNRPAGIMPSPTPSPSSDPADWIPAIQTLRPGERFSVTATSYLNGGWYHVVVLSDNRRGWIAESVGHRAIETAATDTP
jgi:hypothetical protein